MALPEKQKQFIALLMRSPDRGDGWRSVSAAVEPLVEMRVTEYPELYETKRDPSLMVRLTALGRTVVKYQ